jgi:TonB family protein
MRQLILSILLISTFAGVSGQVLQKFEFSDCLTECIGDSAKIDRFLQADDITQIHLTSYANCNGNLEGQIKLTNDTLNLIYLPKMTLVVDSLTGEEKEFLEVAMCDCIFKFAYTIKGLPRLDQKKIKINGGTLDDINKRNLSIEEIVIEFETDSTWSSDDIFTIVEKSAEYPGGYAKFKEYTDKNLVYPKKEKKENIEGKVFVEFVINKNGSIDDTSIKVLKGTNKSFNKEAARLIKECPDWVPANIKGQPVKQKLVFPITFSLSDDN